MSLNPLLIGSLGGTTWLSGCRSVTSLNPLLIGSLGGTTKVLVFFKNLGSQSPSNRVSGWNAATSRIAGHCTSQSPSNRVSGWNVGLLQKGFGESLNPLLIGSLGGTEAFQPSLHVPGLNPLLIGSLGGTVRGSPSRPSSRSQSPSNRVSGWNIPWPGVATVIQSQSPSNRVSGWNS